MEKAIKMKIWEVSIDENANESECESEDIFIDESFRTENFNQNQDFDTIYPGNWVISRSFSGGG